MNVTQRVTIERTSFSHGEVQVEVVTHLVNEEGRVVGAEGLRMIRLKEPEGNWGNKDIEALLLQEQEIVQQPGPPMPATDEIKDVKTGKILRPALPPIPAREAVWKPMFAEGTTFHWA